MLVLVVTHPIHPLPSDLLPHDRAIHREIIQIPLCASALHAKRQSEFFRGAAPICEDREYAPLLWRVLAGVIGHWFTHSLCFNHAACAASIARVRVGSTPITML